MSPELITVIGAVVFVVVMVVYVHRMFPRTSWKAPCERY